MAESGSSPHSPQILNSYFMDATKCCTNIRVPERMNPNDVGDHLSFQLAPPAGHKSIKQLGKIYEHLLDGLAQQFVQTFTAPGRCSLTLLMIP